LLGLPVLKYLISTNESCLLDIEELLVLVKLQPSFLDFLDMLPNQVKRYYGMLNGCLFRFENALGCQLGSKLIDLPLYFRDLNLNELLLK